MVHLILASFSARVVELVGELLTDTVCAVVWPVPEASLEACRSELSDRLGAERASSVRLCAGEAWALDFGLRGDAYADLARTVTHVHVLGWAARAGMNRADAELKNLGSAREALEFARVCSHLQRVVFHSSLAVSGDRTGLFLESELHAGQKFPDPTSETLARAELMFRRQGASFPITVLRLGQLVGRARDGWIGTLDGLHLLLLVGLSSPQDFSALLPRWGDHPLHVLPTDFWCRAAVLLSKDPRAQGRTLHLTDPAPLSVRAVFNRCVQVRGQLQDEGFSMPPLNHIVRRMEELPRDPGASALLRRPWALLNWVGRDVRYDTTDAGALLSPAGLICPSLSGYCDLLVRQVARTIGALPLESAPPKASSA